MLKQVGHTHLQRFCRQRTLMSRSMLSPGLSEAILRSTQCDPSRRCASPLLPAHARTLSRWALCRPRSVPVGFH